MKTSIALCTYNGEKYLAEQLNSYLLQTLLPGELIVCDDCSTDRSIEILNSFKEKAPFPVFIYVNEKTLGSTKNFEKAISLCTGDIIFLSDQDDLWQPGKVQKILLTFENNPDAGLVFSNAELVDEKLNSCKISLWDKNFPASEQQKALNGKMVEVLLNKNVVCGATAAFRTKYRNSFTPIPADLSMIHDGWLAFIVSSLSGVIFLNEELIKYRQHPGQQIGVIKPSATPVKKIRLDICNDALAFYQKRKAEMIFLQDRLLALEQKQAGKNSYLDLAKKIVSEQISKASDALKHFEVRKSLGSLGIKKLPRLGKELLSGGYHKFSNGISSAIKDLLFQ